MTLRNVAEAPLYRDLGLLRRGIINRSHDGDGIYLYIEIHLQYQLPWLLIKMTLDNIQHVGFIGLGAMGKLMAVNLIQRLPENTKIHLFDIVDAPVDELYAQYSGRVVKNASAKQVAEASVCIDHSL